MKIVAVGSKNPVKINSVKIAFERVWPNESWKIEGVNVKSDVSDQPMSDEESIRGAGNRAQKALKKLSADFGVGLEGGLQKISGIWFDSGWMVVVDKSGHKGIGSSVKSPVPKKIMKIVVGEKQELSFAIDKIFNAKNLKQNQGHFGVMTKNLITRTTGYTDGLIMALTAFIHRNLFED